MKRLLGKTEAKHDPRTLKLADYISAPPATPAACDWTKRVTSWGMYENDTCGDCTIAAACNMIRCWTANGQLMQVGLPDELAVATYSSLSGYTAADPTTDTGLAEVDVLKYWKSNGIGGRKVTAFMSINPHNLQEVMLATYLFGGIYGGFQLPLAYQSDLPVWTPIAGPSGIAGSWGGHAAPVVAFDVSGLTIITWGAPQRMTWPAWTSYADEAWAVLSEDFLTDCKAPNGFDLMQLEHDLEALPPATS